MSVAQRIQYQKPYQNTIISIHIQTIIMGNELRYKFKSSNSKIGEISTCPNCFNQFPESTTYYELQMHVDFCFQNYKHNQQAERMTLTVTHLESGDSQKGNSVVQKFATQKINMISKLSYGQIATRKFQQKYVWLTAKLAEIRQNWLTSYLQIDVDFNQPLKSTEFFRTNNLRNQIKIQVKKSIVKDAGGILKSLINLIFQELIKEGFLEQNKQYYELKHGQINQKVIQKCELIGALLGKALLDHIVLDNPLNPILYHVLIGKDLNLQLLEAGNPQIFSNLTHLLSYSQKDLQQLDLYFTTVFKGKQVELIVDGKHKKVTTVNRNDYIKALLKGRYVTPFQEHFYYIRKKFYQVVQPQFMQVFDGKQLALILNGVAEINVEEWKKNTTYPNAEQNQKVVGFFWSIVQELNQKQIKYLLKYISGVSRLPVTRFTQLSFHRDKFQPFIIQVKNYKKYMSSIEVFTCFNRVHLQKKASKQQLYQQILHIVEGQLKQFWTVE